MRLVSNFLLTLGLLGKAFAGDFSLTVLHTNDLHSHAEPVSVRGKSLGGYARQATLIREWRKKEKNTILLNGGDIFQGTLFFGMYEGLSDGFLMDLLGYQAAAVGNHEFDKGTEVLGTFIQNIKFPMLSANIDFSGDKFLRDRVKASMVVNVNGEWVGLIGATTPDLPDISNPGTGIRMRDLKMSIRQEVKSLQDQKVNKIILLSHCGYDLEKELASDIEGIDVVVGGHSHSYLGKLELPGPKRPQGPYPTVVKSAAGKTVLVLQSWEWGKVFGHISIDFNDAGEIKGYRNEGPTVVDDTIPEDPQVKSAIEAFAKPILKMRNSIVGESSVNLTRGGGSGESAMGNLIADAMLESTKALGAEIALVNSGGIRAPLEKGKLTYDTVYQVQPFNNTLFLIDLTGDELLKTLAMGYGGREDKSATPEGAQLQVSTGFRYEYSFKKSPWARTSASLNGVALDPAKTYRVVVPSFLAGGGDAQDILKNAKGKRIDTGIIDLDALLAFIKAKSPLTAREEGRVRVTR